ncbi:MAG: FAD binding domain-containing protein [Melioribacteraceae bacterium]|nr:FAD binding domain-containing protein [Melioribacteraceae bacterium]
MAENIEFFLNAKKISTNVHPAKTLLDFIRVDESLKGTKEGCREGDCGACTVLVGEINNDQLKYKSVNSCLYPIGNADGKHVVTIEGLNNERLTPIQEEFNNEGATQCGFCTPGFVNSLTGYVIEHKELNNIDAETSIAGNICRCTGYSSIKRTAENVVEKINSLNLESQSRIIALVERDILPKYFLEIEEKLKSFDIKPANKCISKSTIIGGGTDLFVQHADSLMNEDVSFAKNFGLNNIQVIDNECVVGASITIEEFKNSEIIKKHFPSLMKQLEMFASLPIRNSATIGGNLVNASPIGDSAIIFLALNAKLRICNNNNFRIINLNQFHKGYKTFDLYEDEIIEDIIFQLPTENEYFNFEKVSKRTYLDIASVNSALNISVTNRIINSAHLSAGGIAPIPLYLSETSNFLKGKGVSSETILDALNIVQSEISPISDIRGSAEYKRILLSQLLKAHFIKLFPELIDVEVLL